MLYAKACSCEYLGSNYSGWQCQKNGLSIQELIENALKSLYGHDIKIAGSGRTDAGVHAMAQIFSFSSEIFRTDDALIKGARASLPEDIAVTGSVNVSHDFHAGKSIISKTYLYKIINRPVPAPLYAGRALWVRKPIEINALNEILKYFEGNRDFASFCVKKTKKENTIRQINFAQARKTGDEINIEINANGFLHNMVRIIVGTTVKFLQHGTPPSKIADIIEARDRRAAGTTAPACGLYQKEAIYNHEGTPGLQGIPKKFLC